MTRYFEKVLIANRGEIAVRVIRTLRDLGIRSVAVYSEEDRDAMHVRMADEAYCAGPAPSAQSYLVIDRILEACKKSGAQAIHPGYGFLSENAAFAEACDAAKIVFIGPPASAMRAMGGKTSARQHMREANVPVVPGAEATTVKELTRAAREIGFPVMLKASAGGGGKGMRLVRSAEELPDAYERARSEAAKAFGDDAVYLEKAIVNPRHIEIQVLGDQHGNVVHLFERDCSVQRRHQKVIEETPSPAPGFSRAILEQMGEVAVRAAKAVNYSSVGTVEFLFSEDSEFYFLEMNTRLQVEHPITELVTGFDLVREQVRVASGEKLGFAQSDVQRRGHAIECRIYAEDPASGFLPSPGRIEYLRTPSGPGIRDDSAVFAGCNVSSFYDPLLSKLCVWGPDRPTAIARMRRALREYVVTGIRTNLSFHLAVMDEEDFANGRYDTGFIERHRQFLMAPSDPEKDVTEAIAIAAALHEKQKRRSNTRMFALLSKEISTWRRAVSISSRENL